MIEGPIISAVLSLSDVRCIALAAQGFDSIRPTGRVGTSHIRNTIRRLGLLQIDYVNVVTPAHYQVLFSRLGPYDISHLHHLVYRRREFTEQWAHEASIVPVEHWPMLRYRRDTHRVRPYGFEKIMAKHPAYVDWVLEQVRERGPLTGEELAEPEGANRRMKDAWVTVPRAVLEAHFGRGKLAIANRLPNFARCYDLAERVISEDHLRREVDRDEAQRQLLAQAARAHGVATVRDLADYYRMPVREARPRIAELVEAGEIREVRVDNWREPAYLHKDARLPSEVTAAALLSPFDPLIWHRLRTARLFGFDYRFEIFVPNEKRKWGCYVLPFLLGDRLVARVDLKANRSERLLQVLAAYVEPHAKSGTVVVPLANAIQTSSTDES